MTVHGHQPTPGCCLFPGSAVFRGSPDHAELRPEVRSAAGRSNNGGNAELRPEVRSAAGRSNNGGNAELRPEVRSAAGRSNRIAVIPPRPYVRAHHRRRTSHEAHMRSKLRAVLPLAFSALLSLITSRRANA